MVNDMGDYFAAYPDRAEAVAGLAHHIRTRWAPVMRRQMIEHLAGGGAGLSDIAREAVASLARREAAKSAPGGAGEKQNP
jgi:formate dehydrogenase subunit delta